MAGTEAAAKDQKQRLVFRDTKCCTALLARGIDDGSAHGIAGNRHARVGSDMAIKCCAGMLLRDADRRGMLGARLVGKTRHAILLVKKIRHTMMGAPVHQRQLDVGPKADGDIGRALLGKASANHAFGGADLHEGRDERPGARAIKASHIDSLEGKARLRDQRRLETCWLAKEADFVATRIELLCERECGIDVSGSAAGGNGHPELVRHLDLPLGPIARAVAVRMLR